MFYKLIRFNSMFISILLSFSNSLFLSVSPHVISCIYFSLQILKKSWNAPLARKVPKIRKNLNLFTAVNIQNGKSGFVTQDAF